MTRQISFTRLEQALLPGFRDRMDRAESTEDVRKFFAETASTLLCDAMGQPGAVRFEHVSLVPGSPEGYSLAEDVQTSPAFRQTWDGSDLPRILAQMARGASNRYAHLDKNPGKTESKIFHKQGRR
jgi:hypothetical protein